MAPKGRVCKWDNLPCSGGGRKLESVALSRKSSQGRGGDVWSQKSSTESRAREEWWHVMRSRLVFRSLVAPSRKRCKLVRQGLRSKGHMIDKGL